MDAVFDLFLTEQHYPTLCEWWSAQEWPNVALDHLPPKGCGVFLDGHLVAAGFLYINGSALSNFEWIVANPIIRHETRTKVLALLFEGAKEFAKMAGVRSIFTSTRHSSLIGRLEKAGFQRTDEGMTNMIARVG